MITDKNFNRLKWEEIDGLELAGKIKGLEVTAAEPINYPMTDGIILYMRDKEGHELALDISAEAENEEENPFYIELAEVR